MTSWKKHKVNGSKTWYSRQLHKGSTRTILIYPPGFRPGKKDWEVFIDDETNSIFLGRTYSFTDAKEVSENIIDDIGVFDWLYTENQA